MSDTERAQRLRQAREDCGFRSAAAASRAFGWNLSTYGANENGNAPYSFRSASAYADAYGVRAAWLYDGALPRTHAEAEPGRRVLTQVIGRVGREADGLVTMSGDGVDRDMVPLPPGGGPKAVAVRVVGRGLRGLAEQGGLIYFEDRKSSPVPDLLGIPALVAKDDGEVLVSRLFRAARAYRFDLESFAGPLQRDCSVRWAEPIIAIVPPYHSGRILRRAGG